MTSKKDVTASKQRMHIGSDQDLQRSHERNWALALHLLSVHPTLNVLHYVGQLLLQVLVQYV